MRPFILIALLLALVLPRPSQAGIAERIKTFVPSSLTLNIGSTQASPVLVPTAPPAKASLWSGFWAAIDRTLRNQIAYISIPIVITPTSLSVTPMIGLRAPSAAAVPIATAQIPK